MAISIKVNGIERTIQSEADTPLLWVVRDELGLTGTKFGCGVAMCGACTLYMAGRPIRSCSMRVSAVDGEITTIEAVDGRVAEAVQSAWISHDVPQCGYCQSGQVMSAIALLRENPNPDDNAIDAAMSGNLCRCATYVRIRAAIHSAAKALRS
jgi:isoquinoline 1-oxidoreductase alpha subunit